MSLIYRVDCVCGIELVVKDIYMDSDNDVTVTVHQCPDCMKEAEENQEEND